MIGTPASDGLSVFFPAHDEAGNIAAVVESALDVLPAVAPRHEVIVVDDGSSDGTAAVVDALVRRHGARVRLVRHERRRGYGAALRTGFAASHMPWVFFSDGDGQFDLTELPAFLEPIRTGEAQIVIGYRVERRDPPVRLLYGRAWGALVRAALGVHARDVNCAFKVMPTETVKSLELCSESATVSAELLAKLERRGCPVVERPVTHRARRLGRASGGSPRVIAAALLELARVRGAVRRMPQEPHA